MWWHQLIGMTCLKYSSANSSTIWDFKAWQCHARCCRLLLTLDVVAKDLAVALGTSLSKSLSSLAAARHTCEFVLHRLLKLLRLEDRIRFLKHI